MTTILITGSTDGIGKLTAERLAHDGYQVLLHGRNPKKLESAVSEIKSDTDNEKVYGYLADLSDFESIQKMIEEITKEHSTIDVLINNAGVFKSSIEQNTNGLDLRFAVNYLAPVLLTNGLLPTLRNSASPRVINLSSAAQASVSLEALKGTNGLGDSQAYAQSKLALTMWSFYFSQQHPEINIIAVNPGSLLNTNMVKDAYGYHWSPADKGADILHELAISKKHTNSSGKYFDNDKEVFSNAHMDAYSQQKIEQLISETNKILNNEYERFSK